MTDLILSNYTTGSDSSFKGTLYLLMIEVLSVGGRLSTTAIKNTVMLSMAEMARVIFSPDSLGIMKTNKEMMLMRTAGITKLTM